VSLHQRLLAPLLGLVVLLSAGCVSTPPVEQPNQQLRTFSTKIDATHKPSFLGLPLKSGQLVLTEAPGVYSFFFGLVPAQFFRFTHVAVLVFEEGKPWVYDTAGKYKLGFDDRPTDAIEGKVQRTPFYEYCKANLYAEIYDPPVGADPAKMVAFVKDHFAKGTPFDAYFDYREKKNLYCSELVAEAVRAAGGKPPPLIAVRDQRSMRVFLEWMKVPLDRNMPAGSFADPARKVGALVTLGNPVATACYFEAKREICRRFTKDQKIGNVFKMAGYDIDLHDEIDQYIRKSINLFAHVGVVPDKETIREAVRNLAEEMLGPVDLPDFPDGEALLYPAKAKLKPSAKGRRGRRSGQKLKKGRG